MRQWTRGFALLFVCLAVCPPAVARDMVVRLKTSAGSYLQRNAAAEVAVDGNTSQPRNELLLVDENGGDLMPGEDVYLMFGTFYVSADYSGTAPLGRLMANTTVVGEQSAQKEHFIIDRADGKSDAITDGMAVTFRSYKRWNDVAANVLLESVCEENVVTLGLAAQSRPPFAPEQFKLEVVSNVSRPAPVALSSPLPATNAFHTGSLVDLDFRKAADGCICTDWKGGRTCYDTHDGIDIGAGEENAFQQMNLGGLSVVSVADGTVVAVDDGNSDRCHNVDEKTICPGDPANRANLIAVRHTDGNVAIYAHIMRGSARVSVGDSVVCGKHLAKVGSSGGSSAPHLHFQLRQPHDPTYFSRVTGRIDDFFWRSGGTQSRIVDPMPFFQLDERGMPKVTCRQDDLRLDAARDNGIISRAALLGGAEFDPCRGGNPPLRCALPLFCSAGRCTKPRAEGEPCADSTQCTAGLFCNQRQACARLFTPPQPLPMPPAVTMPTTPVVQPPPPVPAPRCSASFVDGNPFQSGTQYVCCEFGAFGRCLKVRYVCVACGQNVTGCIEIDKGQGDIDAACGVR